MPRLRFWITHRFDLCRIALEYERVAQQAVADRNRFADRLREMGVTI